MVAGRDERQVRRGVTVVAVPTEVVAAQQRTECGGLCLRRVGGGQRERDVGDLGRGECADRGTRPPAQRFEIGCRLRQLADADRGDQRSGEPVPGEGSGDFLRLAGRAESGKRLYQGAAQSRIDVLCPVHQHRTVGLLADGDDYRVCADFAGWQTSSRNGCCHTCEPSACQPDLWTASRRPTRSGGVHVPLFGSPVGARCVCNSCDEQKLTAVRL